MALCVFVSHLQVLYLFLQLVYRLALKGVLLDEVFIELAVSVEFFSLGLLELTFSNLIIWSVELVLGV